MTIRFFLAVLIAIAFGSCAGARAEDTVFSYAGHALRGSKWRSMGLLQQHLNDALLSCGVRELQAGGKAIALPFQIDGLFGQVSSAALRMTAQCPAFADKPGAAAARSGTITAEYWRALTGTAPPSPLDRAFVAWLTFEGTDYDRMEWNINSDGTPQHGDPHSGLTWGPYGATVGYGGEVQQILATVDGRDIDQCFGSDAGALRRLLPLRRQQALDLLVPIASDSPRRLAWNKAFACLGQRQPVRDAYEKFAWGKDWFAGGVRKLLSTKGNAPGDTTDVDVALAVDLAIHATITDRRISAIKTALHDAESSLGRPLQPAEWRDVVGKTIVAMLGNVSQKSARRARNTVFTADALGIPDSVKAEWADRAPYKASQFGLADRPYWPF